VLSFAYDLTQSTSLERPFFRAVTFLFLLELTVTPPWGEGPWTTPHKISTRSVSQTTEGIPYGFLNPVLPFHITIDRMVSRLAMLASSIKRVASTSFLTLLIPLNTPCTNAIIRSLLASSLIRLSLTLMWSSMLDPTLTLLVASSFPLE
jgi:hypothetical protein